MSRTNGDHRGGVGRREWQHCWGERNGGLCEGGSVSCRCEMDFEQNFVVDMIPVL